MEKCPNCGEERTQDSYFQGIECCPKCFHSVKYKHEHTNPKKTWLDVLMLKLQSKKE